MSKRPWRHSERAGVEAWGQVAASRKPVKTIAQAAAARGARHVFVRPRRAARGWRRVVEGDLAKEIARKLGGAVPVEGSPPERNQTHPLRRKERQVGIYLSMQRVRFSSPDAYDKFRTVFSDVRHHLMTKPGFIHLTWWEHPDEAGWYNEVSHVDQQGGGR